MYYAEQNFAEITGDSRSLIIAFSNLLERYDLHYEPVVLSKILTQDHPAIDWWSIAEYIDEVELVTMSEDEVWPQDNTAIVKFRRIDEMAAGPVDHYAVVADLAAGSIIDSLDGSIKNAREYGTPLGYATYSILPPVNEDPDLPREPAIPADRIRYEALPAALEMHVCNPEGTRKELFGKIKDPDEINYHGPTYAENANLNIVALALVPIHGERITFYMDALSYGNGHITITSGFREGELAPGHVVYKKPEKPVPPPQPEIKPVAVMEVVAPPTPPPVPVSWRLSYRPFKHGPIRFQYEENITVYDLAKMYEPIPRPVGGMVDIAGSFTGPDNRLYYRPIGAAEDDTWYGIDPDYLTEDPDIMNYTIPLADRIAARDVKSKLTTQGLNVYEKYWQKTAKGIVQAEKFKVYLDSKVKKPKEKN